MGGRSADEQRAASTAAILRALSSLAIDRRAGGFDVSGSGPTAMAWLGGLRSSADDGDATKGPGNVPSVLLVDPSDRLQALQRYDALTPGSLDLRLGWMWVVGTARIGGEDRRLVLPLLSRPVRVQQAATKRQINPVTAWDLWSLVDDPTEAAELESAAAFGGGALGPGAQQALVDRLPLLQSWVQRVLAASGLPPVRAVLAPADPIGRIGTAGLVAIAGYGVFADEGADPSRPKETLANWSTNRDAAHSALATLYLGVDPVRGKTEAEDPPGQTPILSPFPLTSPQRDVVHRAGRSPITVVSGPPGTGKSQTAVAAALHAIGKGQSVLVATQSPMAADVLAELFDRVPGPTPVLFGGTERGAKLAQKLSDGLAAAPPEQAADLGAEADAAVARIERAIAADLGHVASDAAWRTAALLMPTHLDSAPLLFADDVAPTAEAEELLARCHRPGGLFGGWRRRRAERRLRRLTGGAASTTLEALGAAVAAARVRDDARNASAGDRDQVERRWDAYADAERDRKLAEARELARDLASRADADSRRAVAALATALRSGRAARHSHLNAIDVHQLTTALPLWVGTLGDIEHLLPATAAAFDLVILDEASQIDQLTASSALLRAKRATVIGDPRQLRFVSFLSDAEIRATLRTEDLSALHDRLDLRRVSAFDLAASSAPVTFLDEHFRCVPHLIGFSASRFYDGRLTVATRHPRNEGIRAIEVRHLDGQRERSGANPVEVAAAVDLVEELLATTTGTIGVISPYRPQVDAIRKAVGERIPIEQLQTGRVRVATVHGVQGAECDVVIASFSVSTGRGRAFLEDPNLFNVLVTRARQRMVVLVSGTVPTAGLTAEYLRWAEHDPQLPPDAGPADRWTADLVSVLTDQGTPVRAGYQVGRWTLDLVIGTGDAAVAVTTRVHPDGAEAHMQRHLALDLAGWEQAEAFPATHDGDAVTTALALSNLVAR